MKVLLATWLTAMSIVFSAWSFDLTAEQKEIKYEIIRLSLDNISNVQDRSSIRSKLDTLVAKINRDLPQVDEERLVKFSAGSWWQIWSDEQNNNPSPAIQNLERIYQYVDPSGEAINIGERILPDNKRLTFALKAKATLNNDIQTTKIVSGYIKNSGLNTNSLIEFLAFDILEQRNTYFSPFTLQNFPRGPINAQSDLKIVYLDNDLKIGIAPNVFNGKEEMFVLIRQNLVL